MGKWAMSSDNSNIGPSEENWGDVDRSGDNGDGCREDCSAEGEVLSSVKSDDVDAMEEELE